MQQFWLAAPRPWETLSIPCHRDPVNNLIKVYKPHIMDPTCSVSVSEVVLTAARPPCARSQVQFPQRRLRPASASAAVALASQPVKCERPDPVGTMDHRSLAAKCDRWVLLQIAARCHFSAAACCQMLTLGYNGIPVSPVTSFQSATHPPSS